MNSGSRVARMKSNDVKSQSTIFQWCAKDLLHILDQIMRTAILNLAPLMTRAERNDYCSRGDSRANARRGVLENNTSFGGEAKALSSEEKWIRSRLARLEPWIISGDGNSRRNYTDAIHSAVG
jgi:hypothetical protein